MLTRASEIDGNFCFLLDAIARLIEGKHPLAATLLRRAMIEDTLNGAKSSGYKHAVRHLLECQSLASSIQNYGAFDTHDAFASRQRTKHSRKVGFGVNWPICREPDADNWLRVLRGAADGVNNDLGMLGDGARFAAYRNDLRHSERFLGMQRTSGTAARRAGLKFNRRPAATEDQI